MGRIWTELTTLCVLVAVVNIKAKDTQGQHTLANTSITALCVGQRCKCIQIRLKLQLGTNRKENDMGVYIDGLEIPKKAKHAYITFITDDEPIRTSIPLNDITEFDDAEGFELFGYPECEDCGEIYNCFDYTQCPYHR